MGAHSAPVQPRHVGRLATTSTLLLGSVAGGVMLADPAQADPSPAQWNAITHCESGGTNAQNPSSTASGFFQILDSTWRGHGGTQFASRARDASYAQQLLVALNIWKAAGGSFRDWSPSQRCWAPLMVTGSAPEAREIPHDVPAAAPAQVVLDTVTPMTTSYTVKAGDTLSQIAAAHGISTGDLYLANRAVVGGNMNLIFPGQVLRLSGVQAPAPAAAAHAAPVTDPLHNYTITQGFKGAAHEGIDMATAAGQPIYSATAGVVEFAGAASGFGDWIVVASVVDGMKVDFVYGHEYPSGVLVHKGQGVAAGDQIGRVGANGNATGPHLHFEVWIGGRIGGHPVDPVSWMAAHAVRL